MPENRSPAGVVLEALGLALFERGDNSSLRAIETPPSWLRQLWPALDSATHELPIGDASPFLENFLIDAEECWRAGGDQRSESGPWIEQTPGGEPIELEATAMTADGRALLLIKQLGEEFEAKKKLVLQKARETVIAHQRLNSEIQKKEILLHCVADEMRAALANIVTSLRLIENEPNPPRSKVLLGLAMRGTEDQQRLINRVLLVFADEIEEIYGGGWSGEVADWNAVLRSALAAAEPGYYEKRVRLVRGQAAGDKAVTILHDPGHLERIVTSLLENALERSRAGDEVKVQSQPEIDSLLFRVIDRGSEIPGATCEDVFATALPPPPGSNAAALRLHFCRVMVESFGGEIGCDAGDGGGSSFWIRLPTIVPP